MSVLLAPVTTNAPSTVAPISFWATLRNDGQYKMRTGPQQTYERSRVFTVTLAWTNITEKQPETAAGRDILDLRSDSHFSLNVDPKTGSKFKLKCVRQAVQNANWTAADI